MSARLRLGRGPGLVDMSGLVRMMTAPGWATAIAPTLDANGRPRTWYKIRNKAADVALVYLYDEIGYWGVTASDFAADLRDITAPTIELHINSPGGECYDGIAIYNTILAHAAEVKVKIDAQAASAASFIAMAGDSIEIARNGEMMIHDAAGLCWGNAAEMRRMVDMLDRMSDNIADIYSQRVPDTDVATWRARMIEETHYSGQEAVDAGLADAVFSGKISAPPAADLDDDEEIDDRVSHAWGRVRDDLLSSRPWSGYDPPQDDWSRLTGGLLSATMTGARA